MRLLDNICSVHSNKYFRLVAFCRLQLRCRQQLKLSRLKLCSNQNNVPRGRHYNQYSGRDPLHIYSAIYLSKCAVVIGIARVSMSPCKSQSSP